MRMRHGMFVAFLLLTAANPVCAGVGDCLKVAFNATNPKDLQRAAAFATQHASCLQNLAPPTLVPYMALSGAVDVANQSGALNDVGLGFGNSYNQCAANLDPGQHAIKQLRPVLQPVCGTLGMNCQVFESPAAGEVNRQITSEVPLLDLMPCACAAATSGLGVERLVELLKTGQQCGATVQEVAVALNDTAAAIAETGQALLDDTTGLLGDLGCAVFGCSEARPPPMPAEHYYALYLEPATQRLLLDRRVGESAFNQRMSALEASCQTFYGQHYDTDNGACTQNALWLRNRIGMLDAAMLQKGENYYNVYVQPSLQTWAFNHFGEDSASWIAQQVAQCRTRVAEAFPMPDPMLRCKLLGQVDPGTGPSFYSELQQQLQQQCLAEQQAWVLPSLEPLYAEACDPVSRKTPSLALGAMNGWRRLMDQAEAAGCPNSGTPASIRCPDFQRLLACRRAMPGHASLCGVIDAGLLAQAVLDDVNADSLKAGKPRRCTRRGNQVLCTRPLKTAQCDGLRVRHAAALQLAADSVQCVENLDSDYAQQLELAGQVLAQLNGESPPAPSPAQGQGNVGLAALAGAVLKQSSIAAMRSNRNCVLKAPDMLRIDCAQGFAWDAEPERARTITGLLGRPLELCGPDMETDGADLPCLDGVPVAAFPDQAPAPAATPSPVPLRRPLPRPRLKL